ncbi:unnamed protein product [Strongylus vulgaris]|uniref:Uncharacterized protein n=1 Tax=Strongylus vulgaris TaxID=40348 RepID=A0A3P7LC14_STRVU|nr:unnamed protein product [Strongylus vulgaris]
MKLLTALLVVIACVVSLASAAAVREKRQWGYPGRGPYGRGPFPRLPIGRPPTVIKKVTAVAVLQNTAHYSLESLRVKRQWGPPWGGHGMGGMGMGYGGYRPYGYGYGGWRHRRPMMERTVVIHHYHNPWRS